MSNFITIELVQLAKVSGGDGTTQKAEGSLSVQTPGGAGVTASGSQSSSTNVSERNQCLAQMQQTLCPAPGLFSPARTDAQLDACQARLNRACPAPSGGSSGTQQTQQTPQ
jgi:hypothetical protein